MPANWITSTVISSDLLYVTQDPNGGFFQTPTLRSFSEAKVHDPLVVMASAFSGVNELSVDDRVRILESLYDMRHLSQERLWGGKDLQTSNVITDVLIYPDLRLSYTEKILSVANLKKDRNFFGRQQEAIYTFYLPEGAVVSSLSLWINGQEEKGILTTKAKADSAYKTIVGVESRDPSVVHWQEGNTVSVRVFPCTPEEVRRFKIGITAPLEVNEGKVVYNNIVFKGPYPGKSNELINLRFSKIPENLTLPSGFKEEEENLIYRESAYEDSWSLSFDKTALKDQVFSFANQSYTIKETNKKYAPYDAEVVYLDINNSWTEDEFEKVYQLVKEKKAYAGQEEITALTDDNKNKIFQKLHKLNYSLPPLHKIKGESLLIVSKSAENSPNLKEIKGSKFAGSLKDYLSEKKDVKLFTLNNLSPYLKTLKEFRAFEVDKGDIKTLEDLIKKKVFVSSGEDEKTVSVLSAGFDIVKSEGAAETTAPDHIMRIYNYNDILKAIGRDYFKENYINDVVLAKASQSYVVSPISSLIVLETQKDYDRFGIKDEGDGLKNASMQSSGAIPEPHEWALFIIALMVIFALLYNRYKKEKYVN